MLKGLTRTTNMFRNISNPWAYLAYKIKGIKGDFTFKAPHGIQMNVPKRLVPTFKEMFFRAPYLEGMPKGFIKTQTPVVVDIGANAGYLSFFVLSKFPKAQIHAFEPFPPNFSLLKSYQEQHAEFGLHIYQKAVAGTAGQMTFQYKAGDEFSTSASLTDNGEGATMTVETVTLPAFAQAKELSQIDWLKVDCEGAEYDIFRHLDASFLKRVQAITLETHDSQQQGENLEALAQQLSDNGFQVKTNAVSPLIWAWRN